jgi:putative mRNA 3-end processing factor
MDHMGYLPAHMRADERRTPYFCTPPTEPLMALLLQDALKISSQKKQEPHFSQADLRRMHRRAHALGYGQPFEFFDGTKVELLDAGHVLGSAQALVTPPKSSGELPLLYSGDLKLLPSRMHEGARLPSEHVGTLVVESTYADREHPPRKELERQFCSELKKCVEEGRTALVASFAVGRPQELVMVLHENNVNLPVYLDGMAQAATKLAAEYPSYVRDSSSFSRALSRAHFVSEQKRPKLGAHEPAVIITTAGMLEGGPALGYIKRLHNSGRLKVFLTGYQIEGTNGRRLLDKGVLRLDGEEVKLGCEVQFFDFSAHSGKSELFDYVRAVNPQKVFCVHGEGPVCEGFALHLEEGGFDAVAPELGSSFEA